MPDGLRNRQGTDRRLSDSRRRCLDCPVTSRIFTDSLPEQWDTCRDSNKSVSVP
ncbi:hypothetical protein DPMN_024309 [Dreissena polymorpha]|uniref:Uncharacterized protein n=1 Tax=Dreissena polymorpha TaxID=45954 RepID=A0A9D4LNW3_DREPO|nr:hypothetical protein DPMN_024309 [Dreissena polymorpha]